MTFKIDIYTGRVKQEEFQTFIKGNVLITSNDNILNFHFEG